VPSHYFPQYNPQKTGPVGYSPGLKKGLLKGN
jgi:hypothetical protein